MMRSILLAEDDRLVRVVLRRVLVEFAEQVVDVEDGKAALDAISGSDFEMVITDLRMPGADGLEVLRAAKDKNASCIVVLISGYAEESAIERATALGGSVLHKPFGADEIRKLLDGLLTP